MYSWYRLHRKVSCLQLVEDCLPGVSILKPLTGVDPNLFTNLETFFNLKYPTVSIHVHSLQRQTSMLAINVAVPGLMVVSFSVGRWTVNTRKSLTGVVLWPR